MKENTEEIDSISLDSGSDGPHVLLLAGVHGDEYEPMMAVSRLRKLLKGQLLKGRVTLVPHVNLSAYRSVSRYGEDGLDLARICPGRADGSVTERSADAVSRLIRTADYLVDMHTGGIAYDIFPLAGYMLHPDPSVLEMQREMARSYCFPVIWGTDPLPDGRTLSIARDAGIPAVYLEYGGGTGFRPHVAEAYTAGTLNLLKYFGMLPGESSRLSADACYEVEDYRPDSGFLQGKMPSPADGIFIAGITPGTRVRQGEKWGEIADPGSGEVHEVFADMDGLAFLLRNIVKVKKGDALGGILPIMEYGRVVIR